MKRTGGNQKNKGCGSEDTGWPRRKKKPDGRKGPVGSSSSTEVGAADREAEGPVGLAALSQPLVPRPGKRCGCCSGGRFACPEAPGDFGPAWACGSSPHSTRRRRPLAQGPASPLGQSRLLRASSLRRRPRRPWPEVALTRSLRLAVRTAPAIRIWARSRARARRASVKESANTGPAGTRPGSRAPGRLPLLFPAGARERPGPTRPELRPHDGRAHPSRPAAVPGLRTYPGGCGRAARPAAPARRT